MCVYILYLYNLSKCEYQKTTLILNSIKCTLKSLITKGKIDLFAYTRHDGTVKPVLRDLTAMKKHQFSKKRYSWQKVLYS